MKKKGGKAEDIEDKSKKGKKGVEDKKVEEEEKKKSDGPKVIKFVKARHILATEQTKINLAYERIDDEYGGKPTATQFGKVAQEFSECSSAKKGGDLGWFSRGKMAQKFEDAAFKMEKNTMSKVIKTE